MKYNALKKHIIDDLKENLSSKLTYHTVEHTLNVLEVCTELSEIYSISPYKQRLLQTAALAHETGMITVIDNHEQASVAYIEKTLPAFGYSMNDIENIRRLILATKMPHHPQTLLECIICDADLDYLGRADYFTIADRLRNEWILTGDYPSSLLHWYTEQENFLTKHNYFTSASQLKRNDIKLQNIAQLRNLIALEKAVEGL